jgi:hypothetical protein
VNTEQTEHQTATDETETIAPTSDVTSGDIPDPIPLPTPEERAEDRLFTLVAVGLMVLLLICVVLALVADRRPPAGL